MQAKLTNEGPVSGPTEWYQCHESDYKQVLERLSSVRSVTLTGDLTAAARNLKRSYVNAVMSIQTDKDRHERAFTALMAGDKDVRDAMGMTVYGYQKGDWVEHTFETVDWANVALAVRAHVRDGRIADLLDMSDHIKGVAHTKWAFTLAMAGVWEVACIDSNVTRHLGLGDGVSHDANTADEYADLIDRVRSALDVPVPPFLAQWVVYDFERGEHARHMPFFREVNCAE